MELSTGTILANVSSGGEDYFDEAIVLVVAHDRKGTVGVVLNRPFGRMLTDLETFRSAPTMALLEGGPMQQDHLYFLHCTTESLGGDVVHAEIRFGGDFEKALSLIRENKIPKHSVKIFVGYCGWDAGQLEAEMENGGWKTVDTATAEIFYGNETFLLRTWTDNGRKS